MCCFKFFLYTAVILQFLELVEYQQFCSARSLTPSTKTNSMVVLNTGLVKIKKIAPKSIIIGVIDKSSCSLKLVCVLSVSSFSSPKERSNFCWEIRIFHNCSFH